MNKYTDDPLTEPHYHLGQVEYRIVSLLAEADKLREVYKAFRAAEKRRDAFLEKKKKAAE